MAFFDLSIPYKENAGASASDTLSHRDSRLRTAARAMELGYTAVAYDRPFSGVLCDADRCRIAPFTSQSFLGSITGSSPSVFTAAVTLHRELLSVPRASPFRQYTRITVSVDSAAAASALNSGNRLLRSYDIVAAWPVTQVAFDQACKASDVDIISLNLSQKLPFRLKQAVVQAAIKRGVHFEISYSHLIAGGHARRQILSEAKRLVEWARGKNLVISGSATSLSEVRGPHDVANLATVLLGLTMERAKAAVSKNCRSLVINALRKKDCYFKEAIKIERILPEEKVDSQGNWFKDWNDWDPLSTGVDDLPSLDDMAKLFSAASTHSKSKNGIDLTSSVNGISPDVSLLPCANKRRLDYTIDRHPSSETEYNNVAHVSMEAPVMVANCALNATNDELEPCIVDNGMDIDAFENPYCPRTSSSGGDFSLTGLDLGGDHAAMENTDQADSVIVFLENHKDVADFLNCSSIVTIDQMSMVDSGTIITVENHDSQKMVNTEEKKSSSSDMQINGNPDMMDVHELLDLPHEASTSKDPGGQERLDVQLEAGIFDDAQVKGELENHHDSTATLESTIVNLFDFSPELEMQVQLSALTKKTDSNVFTTNAKGKKAHVSTADIPDTGILSEDPSTRTKKHYFSPEHNTTLKKAVMEAQSIKQLVTAGVKNGHLHDSGKCSKFRGRSNQLGYLLSVKNFCKSMLFKKKTRRSRRGHRFLYV